MPSPLVQPEYGPTLPELAGPLVRRMPRWTVVVLAVVAVAVGAAIVAWIVSRETAAVTEVAVTEPVAFTFDYWSPLRPAEPRGEELARVEYVRDGLFLQSFSVEPLRQPATGAGADRALPVLAVGVQRNLSRRFEGFQLTSENTTRVSGDPAYAFTFDARMGERLIGGRATLVPEQRPRSRTGALLIVISTPTAGHEPGGASTGFVGPVRGPMTTFKLDA